MWPADDLQKIKKDIKPELAATMAVNPCSVRSLACTKRANLPPFNEGLSDAA